MDFKLNDASLQHFYLNVTSTGENSGLDLYVPHDIEVAPRSVLFLNHGVSASTHAGSGFYLYPRSSISRTPLRLANSVGIIDPGYRGNIIAALENTSDEPFLIQRGQRLVQLCMPDLRPFRVSIVNELSETARGGAGFGSSGR